jgi:GAF domain-containing protein
MLPAPVPANEPARLNALRQLQVLDTPPEARFDRLLQFAADEFDMPIVLLSLVDESRLWFKSRIGLEASEIAREASFCAHATVQPELFVVEDASGDPRFAGSPLVLGAPYARFYCGAPLQLPSGAIVGTLCLIDTVSRQFGPLDQAILAALRDMLVDELQRPQH